MTDSIQTVTFWAKTEVSSKSNGFGRPWLTNEKGYQTQRLFFVKNGNTDEREPQSDIHTYRQLSMYIQRKDSPEAGVHASVDKTKQNKTTLVNRSTLHIKIQTL